MSGSREKLRAVFLAFVMVVSVFGATVAFSGSATAAGVAEGTADGNDPALVDAEYPGGSGTTIFLTFDEGVFTNDDATGSLEAADLSLSDDLSGSSIQSIQHTPGSAIAEITIDSGVSISAGNDIDINADQVFDASGNNANGESVALSNDAPVIAAVESELQSAQVTVTFTEPVEDGSDADLESSDFSVSGGSDVGGILSADHTAGQGLDSATAVVTTSDGSSNRQVVTTGALGNTDIDGATGEIDDTEDNDFSTDSTTLVDSTVPLIDNANTVDADDDGTVDRIDVQLTEPIDDSDSTIGPGAFASISTGTIVDVSTTNPRSDVDDDDSQISIEVSGVGQTDSPDITLATGQLEDLSGNSLGSSGGSNQQFTNTDTGLVVSTSPDSATRGETVNLNVNIETIDDSDFSGTAQVAVLGFTNADDDGNPNADNAVSTVETRVLKTGSTTSGTFTTSITLNGQDTNGFPGLMDDYFVVVRKGGTGFSTGASDTGNNPFAQINNNDAGTLNNIQGSTVLSASPTITSETATVERGSSSTISGSVTVADGSGIANFPISVRNVNDSSQIGSTTTAGNGDFSTTLTFDDAAVHSPAGEFYNASTNSLGFDTSTTFEVTPNDLSVSTSSNQFTASIGKSDQITLTADGADTQENAFDVNVTRFELSGNELSQVDVSNDGGNAYIDQVVLTDGTEIGDLDQTEEFAPGTADPDGDNTDEIDTTSSGTGNIVTDNANVERIVLGTDDTANGANGDNALDVELLAPSSGSLTVEGQVEDIAQGPDSAPTPASPDFVGTQTITVAEPGDLNVDVSPTNIDVDDGDVDPTNDRTDVTITVRDSDGNGIIDGPGSGDIQTLEFEINGNGTQFELEQGDDGDIQSTGGADAIAFDNGAGESRDSASVTIDESGGSDDISGDSTQFVVADVLGEQNGTIDVSVTADIQGQSNDVSDTASIDVSDSVAVEGLPSGDLTVNTARNLSVRVTDGSGTPLNNRQVVIGAVGDENTDSDVFAIDTDGDGANDKTGIDAFAIDGATGTIDLETNGDGGYDEDTISGVTVNNGEYNLTGLNITAAGEDITVIVTDGGESAGDAKAFFPDRFSTIGQDSFNVSSDVDPMVAGFQEQINLTVTNETGATVTGNDLDQLASNDNAADEITQDGTQVAGDFGTGDTVDTDGDGNVDAIQTTFAPQGNETLNITVDNGDGTQIGLGTIDVVEPDIETNQTGVFTERLASNIEITVVDPRDGSNLFDSDSTPNLLIRSFNGTTELAQIDGTDISEVDSGEALRNQQGSGSHLADISDGNQSVTILPYRQSNDDGPFTFEVSASIDANQGGGTVGDDVADYFGATNFTVEPPQVDTSPQELTVGQSQTVEVVVEDANGDALGNRRVDLSGAGVSVRNIQTDSSGFVAAQVNPPATGTIGTFVASDGGASNDISTDTNQGSIVTQQDGNSEDDAADVTQDPPESLAQEDTVNVTTEQSEFDVTVDPQTVTANTTTTVTVTATNNASGDAVEGASVDLSGAGVNESAQTDANGEAAIDVTASETGTIEVTVNDAGFNSATATITVEEAQAQEPSVSVNFTDQTVPNGTEEVTVDSANFTRADGSAGDYVVVVHEVNDDEFDGGVDNSISAPVGASENLSNGAENITVDLNSSATFEDGDALDSITENVTLRAMLHTTDNDSAFGTRLGNAIDGIEPGDETDDANITVEEVAEDAPANFEVSDLEPQDATVNVSEAFDVSATVENTGDLQGEQEIELRLEPDGDAVRTQTVSLDAGENDTVTFENVTVDTAGEFNHTVASDNDSATGSLTVEQREQEQEPSVSVNFTDQTVPNGTEEVTVDSANFTRADGSAGDYVVVVHVVNDDEFDGGVDNSISAPVGASENLSNGAENITVDLNSSAAFEDGDALDSITENVTLRAMLHTTDNDSAFGTRLGNAIDGIEPGDETDDATITVEQQEQVNRSVEVGRRIAGEDNVIGAFELLDAVDEFRNGEIDPFVLLELIDFFRNETDLSQV